MTRQVAIIQSSYIPWRGYFGVMGACDAFVFLDSVQFTRRDWRSRNRIKTAHGPLWLTVPVRQRGRYTASIDAMEIAEPGWTGAHRRSIELAYRRAPGFAQGWPAIDAAYGALEGEGSLSAVNQGLTRALAAMLGLSVPCHRDVDLLPRAELHALSPTDRLVALCRVLEATRYVSGPSARAYLDVRRFQEHGIEVVWADYSGLPTYPQPWGAFLPDLSVVDLLLSVGGDARSFLGA